MHFLERDNMGMDDDILYKAKQELKRADHLMFVSLKYTRTVDVIKSIVNRLINSFDISMQVALEHSQEQGMVNEISRIPRVRATTFKDTFDPEFEQFINFYYLLRDINKAEFGRAREYRRHVTMTAFMKQEPIEITIDIIEDYFQKTKEFVDLVEQTLSNQNDG